MIKMIKFKLAELIKKKGFKDVAYRTLAEEMKVDHVSLWKMINEKPYNPSLSMIDKLCEFFGCQPGDLMEHRKR